MENSLLYFFSAVPQVLGAVMGLFGLFVLFKSEQLKEELINDALTIVSALNNRKSNNKNEQKKIGRSVLFLAKACEIKNIIIIKYFINKELNIFFHLFDNELLYLFRNNIEHYNERYSLYKKLINFTIIISIFSIIIIVGCLSIIPLKEHFLSNTDLLSLIYEVIIISLCIIFISFIIFLKISLSSTFNASKKSQELIKEKIINYSEPKTTTTSKKSASLRQNKINKKNLMTIN